MPARKKTPALAPAPEPTTFSFETFRRIGRWQKEQWTQENPDCFNGGVSVRKTRVTVELVDEPTEVITERLLKLWRECDNHHHWEPLQSAAKEVGFELSPKEFGMNRKKPTP